LQKVKQFVQGQGNNMDYIVAIDRRGEANKGMRMEREGEGMKMAQQGGKTWHKKVA
jgi:hypothetical protein